MTRYFITRTLNQSIQQLKVTRAMLTIYINEHKPERNAPSRENLKLVDAVLSYKLQMSHTKCLVTYSYNNDDGKTTIASFMDFGHLYETEDDIERLYSRIHKKIGIRQVNIVNMLFLSGDREEEKK